VFDPAPPPPRGPLSELVLAAVGGAPRTLPRIEFASPDPLTDEDLQLALYCCYELHYRSFAGVDPGWEWEPSLIALRREMEAEFLEALGSRVPPREGERPEGVGRMLFELSEADDSPSHSEYLQRRGTDDQFREFLIHRSAYQLKEADPHTWAIPRLHGGPKAALVEVQADEYGSGAPERVHATLFAKAMEALALDSSYGAYLERIPAVTLAGVNLISALGLDRSRRGALVGHLAMFEITSPIPNGRYAKGLRRLGYGAEALDFFLEHVEADSVHENIAAFDLAQGLAIQQPELTEQIVFGAEALLYLESEFSSRLLDAFEAGESSLLRSEASGVPA
jgi:hypothetical protein